MDLSHMPHWLTIRVGVLLFLIFTALITDLLHARIYNWLTFPVIIIGVILQTWSFGFPGFLSAIWGAIFGFVLLLPGGIAGFVGAGDLKLQAGIGSLMGGYFIFWVFLLSSLVAPLYAVPFYLWKKGGYQGMIELYTSITTGYFKTKKIGNREDESVYLHGIAIFFGTLLAILVLEIQQLYTWESVMINFGMNK